MVAESRLPKQRASGVCSTLQNSQQTPMRQQTRYITVSYTHLDVYKRQVQNLFDAFSTFAQIQDYTIITQNVSPLLFLKNIVAFFTSNIFFYNPLLLILTLWALIVNIRILLNEKNLEYAFIIGAILGLLLQTTFSEDYIMRKSIVIFPLLFINIMLAFYKTESFRQMLQHKKNIVTHMLFALFSVVVILILWKAFRVRFDVYAADFSTPDLNILILSSIIQCSAGLLCLYCTFLKKTSIKKLGYIALAIALFGSFFINIYFSFSQVYCNQQYTEKQVAIDLGNAVQSNYVMGPYVYEYSLYNDIYPLVTTQLQKAEYAKSPLIQYYFDYAASSYEQHLNEQIFAERDVYKRQLQYLIAHRIANIRNMILHSILSSRHFFFCFLQLFHTCRQIGRMLSFTVKM